MNANLEAQTAGKEALEAIGRVIGLYNDVLQPHIRQEILMSAQNEMATAIATHDIEQIKKVLTTRQREIITTGQELRNAQSSHQATQNS